MTEINLTDEDLLEARERAAATGATVGEVLLAHGTVRERDVVEQMALAAGLAHVDVSLDEVDVDLARMLDPELALSLNALPVFADDDSLYVISPGPLDQAACDVVALAVAGEDSPRKVVNFLTTSGNWRTIYDYVHSEQRVYDSVHSLRENRADISAHLVISGAQRILFTALVVLLVIGAVLNLKLTAIILVALASVFYLAVGAYKLMLIRRSLGYTYEVQFSEEQIAELDEENLPIYTILVPLFREAAVVGRLVNGINGLDYPRTKLDVKLLCEAEDIETIEAIRALDLPPHFDLIIVPDTQPKTKPKACNYGLYLAKGEYCVIYDAEDRPDPDQLKKAILSFRELGDEVACVQAKLNYFNQNQNILTRWFAIEYAMHFDLLLPGLDGMNVAIPLGGTSNHFRTDVLRELGAWDPFNVTEDADLGIRLYREGYTTAIMDSTTLEEANSQLGNWVRQRSRWIKGYIQTWLVHMRSPGGTYGQMGFRNFMAFNLVVGGAFIFLLNPIFWIMTTIYALTAAGFIEQMFPTFVFYIAALMLFVGNFLFVYLNVAGSMQRGYFGLTKYALFTPVYWGLMSWAAWKGFIQLFTAPFYWEKTEHGLDGGDH
jgi:cellulose synthase/poly-beta-1,6-N-acetylglucosamine synthase-like glycosyltransferase